MHEMPPQGTISRANRQIVELQTKTLWYNLTNSNNQIKLLLLWKNSALLQSFSIRACHQIWIWQTV